jgi:hypothetical protein
VALFEDFVETFDGTLSAWTIDFGSPSVALGDLTLPPNTSMASVDSFDFVGSSVQIDLKAIPSGGWSQVRIYSTSNSNVMLRAKRDNASSAISFEISTSTGGSGTEVTLTYDSSLHRLVRFRQSGSIAYIETSPNGLSWAIQNYYNTSSLKPLYGAMKLSLYNQSNSPSAMVIGGINDGPQIPKFGDIASGEAVESPSFSPGITYVDVGSVGSGEAFSSPQFNMQLLPASVASAEAFGTLLMTLPLASIGGIPSAESVSDVSFTVQYINPDSISSLEAFGFILVTMFLLGLGSIATLEAVEAPTFIQSPPPPPPPTDWSALGKEDEKVFVYKVYSHSGTYIGVWNDVKDDLNYTQQINTPGTTTTVQLARSANTTQEVRTSRITQSGEDRLTQDGDTRTVTYETSNVVGEDTDVELNYNVDIYVHYGEFEDRITQDGEQRITQAGEQRVVATGAPMGIRVFSGFILDYESVYSAEEVGVSVTIASHGYELSNELIRSGETTTVTYSTTPIQTIVKSILDTNPGTMTYDSGSIDSTGVSITSKFQLNSKLEGVESAFEQTPDGWYWYGNVAENLVYLKQKSPTADHKFVLGKHIKNLRVRRSIEGLKNVVYFVGGEVTPGTPASTLFKKYEDTTSQAAWRKGLERITDRRYTVTGSAANRANKLIGRYKNPIFSSPLVISSAKYNIESIKLGQTVQFRNFGNFIDDLAPLQIVSLTYSPTAVTIELGDLMERQIDAVAAVEGDLQNEQYETLPTAPS